MLQFFTGTQFTTSMELGLLYGLVALALYISFGLLKIADLSTDGCFTLGCAVGASMTVTAFLQTRLGVESILAGIIVNTGLYTINFLAMGSSSNLNIFGSDTIFSLAKGVSSAGWYRKLFTLIILLCIVLVICFILHWFLNTTLGLSIRATGDNENMVRASSVNPAFTITVGRTIGVILGSCLYRLIVAIAMKFNMPAEFLKLASALIVTAAIVIPYMREKAAFYRRRMGRGNLTGK